MKSYFLLGCLMAVAGITLNSCSDDDVTINDSSILTQVETGAADVSATSATVYGKILDLGAMTPARYQVGVIYSTSPEPTVGGTRQPGELDADGNLTATITGLTKDVTYFYAAYVTLQGVVTEYGEVKQFTTTDALVATADAAAISDVGVTLGGTLTDVDDMLHGSSNANLAYGILLSTENSADDLQKWNRYEVTGSTNSYTCKLSGLMPSTTYRYAAFMELNGTPYYGTVKTFTTSETAIEWVDMGLSVLWAGVNLGASAPEETGGLYGYGDLGGLKRSVDNGDYARGDISGRDADPAKAANAGRMPTRAEFNDLFNYCNPEQYVLNGVQGWKFTARNGNTIFLPATGVRNGEEISGTDKGAYWTGNAYSTHDNYAVAASLSADAAQFETAPRYSGLALRPVKDKEMEGMAFNPYLIGTGDLENNGNYRIQIYNMYGGEPAVNPSDIHFTDEISVTFSISGITSTSPHQAYIGFAAADWSFQNWEYKEGEGVVINGDGTYTVKLKGAAANAAVFVIDIKGLSADCGGADGIIANVLSIKTDDWGSLLPFVPALVGMGDLENNGNYRFQIFNMYGGDPAIEASLIKFSRKIAVTFRISGISSSADHEAYIGYATSDWSFQNWEYKEGQGAMVNGDGTYTVSLLGSAADAAVFVVDIKGLSADCGGAYGISSEVLAIRAE